MYLGSFNYLENDYFYELFYFFPKSLTINKILLYFFSTYIRRRPDNLSLLSFSV